MKKRFKEEEIVKILQQQADGKTVKEIAREYGISENSLYVWKRKYGGLSVAEVTRLKQLEEENAQLKQLVADLSLDVRAQKEVIKKFSSPE